MESVETCYDCGWTIAHYPAVREYFVRRSVFPFRWVTRDWSLRTIADNECRFFTKEAAEEALEIIVLRGEV